MSASRIAAPSFVRRAALCLAPLGALACPALAAETPLLEKINSPGFAPPAFQISSRCSVFADRIVVTRSVGGLSATETRRVSLTAGDIAELVRAAAGLPRKTAEGPTDVPSTSWFATLTEPGSGAPRRITLASYGTVNEWREGSESQQLRSFLDQVCQTPSAQSKPFTP